MLVPPPMKAVPHRCRFNHTWTVSLKFGYYYQDPVQRFCHMCLEEGRLEIASIQLRTTNLQGGRIEHICRQCEQRTIIALPAEFSLEDFVKDEEDAWWSWNTPQLRWYHLPSRWPLICNHPLYPNPLT